jgi:hypothetical protein
MIEVVFKIFLAVFMAFLSLYWIGTKQWLWAAVFLFYVVVLIYQARADYRVSRKIARLRREIAAQEDSK